MDVDEGARVQFHLKISCGLAPNTCAQVVIFVSLFHSSSSRGLPSLRCSSPSASDSSALLRRTMLKLE
ncbi:hypothetical protein SRHO_G00320620 [Serrasalmus rhombeus]